MSQVWAARDKDGQLAFFGQKPSRRLTAWDCFGTPNSAYADSWDWSEQYGPDPIPELTWRDEPIPVEIEIKRAEQ